VLEVYNEQIHDLLTTESQPGGPAKRLEDNLQEFIMYLDLSKHR
jgi:hypothetical protein